MQNSVDLLTLRLEALEARCNALSQVLHASIIASDFGDDGHRATMCELVDSMIPDATHPTHIATLKEWAGVLRSR